MRSISKSSGATIGPVAARRHISRKLTMTHSYFIHTGIRSGSDFHSRFHLAEIHLAKMVRVSAAWRVTEDAYHAGETRGPGNLVQGCYAYSRLGEFA